MVAPPLPAAAPDTAPSSETPPEAPAAASPTDEPPRIKFKVKPRDAAGAPLPATPPAEPTPAPAGKIHTPPPFPVVSPPGAPPKKFPPPPRVPHMRAPGTAEVDASAPVAPAKPNRSAKKTILVAVAVVLFVAAVATYRFLTAEPPPPPPRVVVKKPDAKPSGAATPSTALNQAAAAPGAAVNSAQNAVTARRTAEQGKIDALVAGQEPVDPNRVVATPAPAPAKTAETPPPPKPTSVFAPVTSVSQIAPGVTALTTTEVGGGIASPAFRSWVANARINGVFQGNPPRALINGRTVRVGQSVDDTLGILFDGFNIDEKTIVFRDRTGATVTRKF